MNLPSVLPMITMWGSWADQLCNGHKPLETRVWQWGKGSGLLAIHCGMQEDNFNIIPLEDRAPFGPVAWRATRGSLCALVWVKQCYPLLPEHKIHSLIYRAGLWAIEIELLALLRGPKINGARGRPINIASEQVIAALEIVL